MRLLSVITPVFLTLFFSGTPVTEYPKDYFQAPVAAPLRLSGTFGELRPNHFHGGIDIKGSIGTPILAAAEGFIAKIIVAPDSYGNHILIQHPNGFTTLYAHLDAFAPAIEAFVRQKQQARERFEITLKPGPGELPVRKGQQIGTMGNSGHSFGPHLHFEIRETAANKPLNPLLFGLRVADAIPPRLHEIKLYELDEQGMMRTSRILPLVLKQGAYRTALDTLEVSGEQIGLAIKAYDHMDDVPNWNGIYALDMYANGRHHFGFKLDGVGQEESRYLNAHIDYLEQRNRGSYFHRCFTLPGNRLSIYAPEKNGLLFLAPGESQKIQLEVRDLAGNTSKTALIVRRKASAILPQSAMPPYQFFWPYDQAQRVDDFRLFLHLPKGALYEDAFIRYSTSPPSPTQFSLLHGFQPEDTPIHLPFSLGLRPEKPVPQRYLNKAFIGQVSSRGSITNWGGQWQDDGMLVASVRSLGYFSILLDTVPPSISIERFSSDMRKYNSMSFKISDNIAASMNLANLQFKGFIDGEWVLFTYDEKNRRITHTFSSALSKGEHMLELEVWDAMGNKTVFTRTFMK